MAERHDEFLELGARVFALSADTVAQNTAVVEKLALPFPILSDPDRTRAITPLGFADDDDPRQISKPGTMIIAPGGEVVYVDMSEYLLLTQRVEISDFLISMLGALSEKVSKRFSQEVGKAGFFERIHEFLLTDVQFKELTLPAGAAEFKAALTYTPVFK
jgi:hypothetical protein